MAFGGILKQSTAVDVLIGPFVDDTDGKTAETGLTISQADVKLSKNGQALAQKNDVTAASHDSDGYYNCELDSADTAIVGQLTLIVHESGALPIRLDFQVIEEAIYDALYAASATGFDANQRVDVGKWLGTAAATPTVAGVPEVDLTHILGHLLTQTGTQIADAFEKLFDVATPVLVASSVMRGTDSANTTVPDAAGTAPTAVEIQAEMEENGASVLDSISDLLPGSTMAAATDIPAMVGTNNAALASVVGTLADAAAAGDPTEADTLMKYIKQLINVLFGSAGIVRCPAEAAPANGVSMAEVIKALHVDVTGLDGDAMVGTNNANTTVPDAAGVAATPAGVATALTDIHLDHLLHAAYDPASKPGAADALLNELVEDDSGVSRFTENSLEQAPSGTGASAATIADAVWNEADTDHDTEGTFGGNLQSKAGGIHYPNKG